MENTIDFHPVFALERLECLFRRNAEIAVDLAVIVSQLGEQGLHAAHVGAVVAQLCFIGGGVRAEQLFLQRAVGNAGHFKVERALEQRNGVGGRIIIPLARFVRFEVAQRNKPRMELNDCRICVVYLERGVLGNMHLRRCCAVRFRQGGGLGHGGSRCGLWFGSALLPGCAERFNGGSGLRIGGAQPVQAERQQYKADERDRTDGDDPGARPFGKQSDRRNLSGRGMLGLELFLLLGWHLFTS